MIHTRWQAPTALFCAALALFSGSALAQQITTAVYSGGAIEWSGTTANLNRFTAENGNALIDKNALSNVVPVTGASFVTRTVNGINANANFCADVPAQTQAAKKAYYVYYGVSGASYAYVISLIPPFAEGYPDQPLTYTIGTTTTTANQQAVFVGSYVTDVNKDMVPFRRVGDSVYFLWGAAWTVVPTPFQAFSWSHNVTLAWPRTLTVNIGANFAFPTTASAAIVGLLSKTTNPAAAPPVVGLLDPQFATIGAATWSPFFSWKLPHVAAFATAADRIRVPTDGTGNISVADLADPPAGIVDTVEVAYEGYVETVHHLY